VFASPSQLVSETGSRYSYFFVDISISENLFFFDGVALGTRIQTRYKSASVDLWTSKPLSLLTTDSITQQDMHLHIATQKNLPTHYIWFFMPFIFPWISLAFQGCMDWPEMT